MECPYCGAELICEDSYGRGMRESFYGTAGNGIHYPSTYEHLGDIYSCPHHEGFESEEEALEYLKTTNETLESLGIESWEEVCCDSCCHSVSGSFYTDSRDELHEGYPC